MDVNTSWLPLAAMTGFSFATGFAMAYASKTLLKIGLFFMGLFFAGLFSLQMIDVISVDWERVAEIYRTAGGWVYDSGTGLVEFAKAQALSAAGLGAGLYVGFKR